MYGHDYIARQITIICRRRLLGTAAASVVGMNATIKIKTVAPRYAVVTPYTRTICDRLEAEYRYWILARMGVPVTLGLWIAGQIRQVNATANQGVES
jgi:hypothetical protein